MLITKRATKMLVCHSREAGESLTSPPHNIPSSPSINHPTPLHPSPPRSPPENFFRRATLVPVTDSPSCAGCGASSEVVWTREATARELATWAADPLVRSVTAADLDPSAAPTLVPVHACPACALNPARAALVHSPACSAPPADPRCPACSVPPDLPVPALPPDDRPA